MLFDRANTLRREAQRAAVKGNVPLEWRLLDRANAVELSDQNDEGPAASHGDAGPMRVGARRCEDTTDRPS